MSEDNLERLSMSVYGRLVEPKDWLGGSQAFILADAEKLIADLRAQLAEAKEEAERWQEHFEIAAKSYHYAEEQHRASRRHFEMACQIISEYDKECYEDINPKEKIMSEIIAADEARFVTTGAFAQHKADEKEMGNG